MATITKDYKTIIQKMQEVAPNYIAKYVEWYLTDPEDRCSWEELCTCDQQFNVADFMSCHQTALMSCL